MKDPEGRFAEIARIGKAHGLNGTIKLMPQQNEASLESLLEAGQILHLENRRGDLIPARITDVRIEKKRNASMFFVHFDQITNRSEAEQFQDGPVYMDRKLLELQGRAVESLPDITGFDVTDPSGLNAVVTGILESPAHAIIGMDAGPASILVPWVDEFVVSIDEENRIINCRNLEQFMDL
ncbi:MAG: hypothetical protein WD355_00070 [Balneolaceae bacterium]